MLKYDENLDGFVGSDDDDDEKVNDDETNIVSIDDLVDNEEVDPDDEPSAEDYCEEFIGFGRFTEFGGPGSGRYPAGTAVESAVTWRFLSE